MCNAGVECRVSQVNISFDTSKIKRREDAAAVVAAAAVAFPGEALKGERG